MTCALHTQTWSTCKACFDNAHTPSAETLRDVATFVPGVPRGCPHCFGYDGSHTRQCASLQGTQEASERARCVKCKGPVFATPSQTLAACNDCGWPNELADSNPAPAATYSRDNALANERMAQALQRGTYGEPGNFAGLTKAADSGWVCPRCQTVHAPFIRSCECRP